MGRTSGKFDLMGRPGSAGGTRGAREESAGARTMVMVRPSARLSLSCGVIAQR